MKLIVLFRVYEKRGKTKQILSRDTQRNKRNSKPSLGDLDAVESVAVKQNEQVSEYAFSWDCAQVKLLSQTCCTVSHQLEPLWAGLSGELKHPGLSSGDFDWQKKERSRNKGTDLSEREWKIPLKGSWIRRLIVLNAKNVADYTQFRAWFKLCEVGMNFTVLSKTEWTWWLMTNWHIVPLGWRVPVWQPCLNQGDECFCPHLKSTFPRHYRFPLDFRGNKQWCCFLETNGAVCFNGQEDKNSHSLGLEAGMPKSIPLSQFVLKQGGGSYWEV